MSADSHDSLPYLPADEVADEAARRHCWACAIGLQAVDGLEVSSRLRELAASYIRMTRGRDKGP